MSETSTNLELPYLQAAQAQKHVTHNAALERLDAIVQLGVLGFGATTPPLAPDEGQVWALGTGAVNDWAGHDGELAVWSNGGWLFVLPRVGWRAALGSELRLWDGSGWVMADLPPLQNLPGVGVGTSYDPTNRLAVAADAVLFTHAGAGHQLKLNKAAAGDTASLLYQTNWSGRAEMGTAGADDWSLKVSPDGVAWQTALTAAAASGLVSLPLGLSVGGPLTLPAGGVSRVALAQGAARSVIGRSASTSGAVADIAAASDHQVLRRSGTTLGFGAVALNQSAAVTGELPLANGGTGAGTAAGARSALGLGTGAEATVTTGPSDATAGRLLAVGAGHQQLDATLYRQGNLVGAVSQSGGLPSGAVIETGSNANGRYTRLADGTQICWGSVSITPVANTPTLAPVTFAAAFISAAVGDLAILVTQNSAVPGSSVIETSFANPATTGCDLAIYRTNTTATAVRFLAIGRWF